MFSVSIIIPNYNGENNLKENIQSVVKLSSQNKEVKEIIVIDDCSSDQSRSYIKTNYPEIKLIEKKINTGFSDSVNIGVSNAKSDLIFLLNTDTKPSSNVLKKLLPYFQDPQTFAVGCLDNSKEGNTYVKRGRGVGKFTKGFLIHKRGSIDQNNTLWVSGGSGIFNKNIWFKLNGMDNLYNPFYWEDIDISYRALKSGYLIYFEKEAEVIHKHSKGVILTSFSQEQIKLVSLRNQIIFVWKNISDVKYLLNHFIYLLLYFFKSIVKSDKIFLKALLRAILKLPMIISHRSNQSKIWVKSDKEIFKQFLSEFL